MLTENGKRWVKYIGNMNQGVGGTKWKRTSGEDLDYYQYTVDLVRTQMGNNQVITPRTVETPPGTDSNTGKWIGIGTGNTAENANDYCLDNFISLDYVGGSANNENGIVNITMTYQNNTSNSVTVKEVGLYLDMSGWSFLMARKVLDTPITIPVGQSRAFTIHIDIGS